MPFALVLSTVAVIVLYASISRYRSLARKIALAKTSGLPFVVTPWNVFSVFWLATHGMWTPLLKRILPTSCQGLWVEYVHFISLLSLS